MRKLLLLALLLMPLAGLAQEGPIPGALIDVVPSTPSGSCFQDLPDQQVTITGALYSCQNGNWGLIAGGGGGGLPSAAAAGAVPVSTGPGTTYVATPGNSTNSLEILTSTPAPASGPTTKSCQFVNGGTVTSVGCTWNIAPQAGETIACTVFGASGTTITMADSETNSYTGFGAGHTNAAISVFFRTFYTAPITGPVTTETATLSVSSFQPGILCNTVNGVAPSSPQDGQVVVDATTAPVTTGTLTTTASGDYILCTGVGGPGSGFANASPFTLGAQYSPFFNSINEYTVQATAGAITATINGSVTTSASLMCSAFKSNGGSTAPTTAFTRGAPFITDNVFAINVKESGAVGDGGLHPACAYLGLATLSELQAYNGGQYSFATSCNNQMDWLATQYAVNKIGATGGTVKLTAGVYIWDQIVILPPNNDTFSGGAPGLYLVGDGEGGTIVEPNVADFGLNSGMISCQDPAATPQGGTGRYGATGACYGGIEDMTFSNPFYNGTCNVSSSTYARGITSVPAPCASGTPIQMDGVVVGARMYLHRVGAWGFRMGFNIVGDHMTWDSIDGEQDFCGLYWAPESTIVQGDIVIQGHTFAGGNKFSGVCVDKDAQLNFYQAGEFYIGFQPYGFIKFPGQVDAYLGSGYFPFITNGQYENLQAENIGNAVMWDDNMTNSGGGVNLVSSGPGILGLSVRSLFTIWGTPITTGGRNQYAWIGSSNISGLTLTNPISCCGSFEQGGSGQIAGVLAQFNGAGGGIQITGDLTDALFTAYNALPLVGNTRYGGYCGGIGLTDPGNWQGTEMFLDPATTSITKGQAVMMKSDGNVGVADGTGPVVGVAAQSFTNPGTGQCLAVVTSGKIVSPYSMAATTSTANGNVLVSASAGQVSPLGPAGGYVVGTVTNAGAPTAPWVALNGMGGFTSPLTTWTSCSMSTSTTCTATVPSGTTSCTATLQGTGTVIGGNCSITSTTATVTAASSNSAVWAIAAH